MKRTTVRLFLILSMMLSSIFSVHVQHGQANSNPYVLYEVKSGDSLWKVSKRYGYSVETIKKLNGLSQNTIVPGQSLLIPSDTYIVLHGESLFDIAFRHSIPISLLAQHNHIKTHDAISPGRKIKVPQIPNRSIKTGGYFVPKGYEADLNIINRYSPLITNIGVFEYHPNWNGNLSSLSANHIIKEAWIKHSYPVAVVTNLSSRGFDPDMSHHLLTNQATRKNLINNIDRLLRTHDYKGVNIDFEGLRPQDRQAFNQFMKELRQKLKPSGFTISIAVPPKQADHYPEYHSAYDYKTLGKMVDQFFIMAYDWHWPGGSPGPIAPYQKVKETLNYAIKVIPKNKIYLGIAMYAYDWRYDQNGKTKGQAYSQQLAIDKAVTYGSPIIYDLASRSPHFVYTDANGLMHEVWFEDARSIWSKYRLVAEYGIAGMGGWQLGLPFPQAETLLKDRFHIQKP
ncbi:glycosyl hydrolase family 18 protein [Aeribacillus alveayuensis]|uniref:Spore germination protein n=1 Tax=Aeribacillus alveayuensis TaxID=279215 RepID=A0ABT9VMG2_9BACI|nr:spore germination protein [Bacillus alveayuensis]